MTIPTGVKDPNLWNSIDPIASTKKGKAVISKTGAGNTDGTFNSQYKTLAYPFELGTARYPYSILFYINANSASELGYNDAGNGVRPLTTSPDASGEVVGANSAGLSRGVNQSSTVQARILAGPNSSFIPSFKRLNMVIALPMPQHISFGENASYHEIAGGGLLGTVLHNFAQGDLSTAWRDAKKQLTQGVTTFGAGALAELVRYVPLVGEGDNAEDWKALVMKAQGVAKNDRKEQVFQGMAARTFNFSWLLIPKTEDESNIITRIIQWLKYNQYPEINIKTGSMQVIIPNEFDIEFQFFDKNTNKSGEIEGMAKITTCVLETLTVNYTPLNKFIAFDGTDNPVAIQLDMAFKELEPLTRAQIAQGY